MVGSSSFQTETSASRSSSVISCPHDAPYVILDTETTGLDPSSDKIIQLSAIMYDTGGIPIDFYNTYLDPEQHIPAGASRVNGITDDMVANAPKAEQVRDDFLAFLGESLIVGYNVGFDLRFLRHTFGDVFGGWPHVDALAIAREFLSLPNYKLEAVASKIGFVPDSTFHDSFTDCEAVAAVLHCIEPNLNAWNTGAHAGGYHSKRARAFHEYISPRTIKRRIDALSIDPDNPFCGQNVVFTGELQMSRAEAMQAVVDLGGIVEGSVSKKTDYLIVGRQNIDIVGRDGKSSKEKKAVELNDAGAAHIEIIDERQFLSIIQWEAYNGRF